MRNPYRIVVGCLCKGGGELKLSKKEHVDQTIEQWPRRVSSRVKLTTPTRQHT